MKRLLLVDDNEKYAAIITNHFRPLGYEIDHALSAADGLSMFTKNGLDHYALIVTDITMESQVAGLFMLRKIHTMGYRGPIVIASTGFDFPGAKALSKLFLRPTGATYLVPKTTVLRNDFEYHPMAFFAKPLKAFPESS